MFNVSVWILGRMNAGCGAFVSPGGVCVAPPPHKNKPLLKFWSQSAQGFRYFYLWVPWVPLPFLLLPFFLLPLGLGVSWSV